MRTKSVLTEAKQIERAVTLIHLGARLQVLESETDLSYERLLRLYKEVSGKSPSKGQLPFSTDWFMTWQPNIHASLFLNIHEYLNKAAALDEIDTIIKAYQLYLEQTQAQGLEPLLSVTRAWRLVKFIDNGMLTMTECSKCGGPQRAVRRRCRDGRGGDEETGPHGGVSSRVNYGTVRRGRRGRPLSAGAARRPPCPCRPARAGCTGRRRSACRSRAGG